MKWSACGVQPALVRPSLIQIPHFIHMIIRCRAEASRYAVRYGVAPVSLLHQVLSSCAVPLHCPLAFLTLAGIRPRTLVDSSTSLIALKLCTFVQVCNFVSVHSVHFPDTRSDSRLDLVAQVL